MKIGVLSDTHIPQAAPRIPERVVEIFEEEEVDLILHAGDICEPFALLPLQELAPLRAVYGNCDGSLVRSRFPHKQLLPIEGEEVTVLLTHGSGSPVELGMRLLEDYLDRGEEFDVLVFGHSHQPQCEEVEGVLLFNPGSPTDKRYARYHSVGILEVEEGKVKGRIVRV